MEPEGPVWLTSEVVRNGVMKLLDPLDMLQLRCVCRAAFRFFSLSFFRRWRHLPLPPDWSEERFAEQYPHLLFARFWDTEELERKNGFHRCKNAWQYLFQGFVRGASFEGSLRKGTMTGYVQPSVAWKTTKTRDKSHVVTVEIVDGAVGEARCDCVNG